MTTSKLSNCNHDPTKAAHTTLLYKEFKPNQPKPSVSQGIKLGF